MKTTKKMATFPLLIILLFFVSSCKTYVKRGPAPGHDNGKHKGWYKNPNNPHHPNSTNPGHNKSGNSNGNSQGNGKSKGKGNSQK